MTSPLSQRDAPELLPERTLAIEEGAGNAGRWPLPMARLQTEKQAAVTTGPAGHPAFPARWAIVLYVISPGTGCLAPVTGGSSSPPAWHQHRDARTTRFQRPRKTSHPLSAGKPSQRCTRPVDIARPDDAVAATASRPASRDDAYAPPAGTERGGSDT